MMMANEEQQIKNKRFKKKKKEEIITKEFLSNQKQELKNTSSATSQTTDKINDNANDYQKMNNKIILEKSIEPSIKYQQKDIDAINSLSNNYKESQENIVNNYQLEFSNFIIENTKSCMTNYIIPQYLQKCIVKSVKML